MSENQSATAGSDRNIRLYPWFRFFQGLIFWQAVWFLFFQSRLSAAEAVLIYAIYDISTTVLEVPSGYMSDRLGRRGTLIASAIAGMLSALLQFFGGSFEVYALAQLLLGASAALASGTDSALLYESLSSSGREKEVEHQELKAWRYSFSAYAISAVLGGILARTMDTLPFLATAIAFAGLVLIAFRFTEPRGSGRKGDQLPAHITLRRALTEPVLVWLFALTVVMYLFSHIPFVFGQPFIAQALESTPWSAEAPLVSGVTSAVMMLMSVATSLVALKLRRRIGLAAILLLAFGLQIGLIGVLALTNASIAILVLTLRMVPNSLSQPFILARIQPELGDGSRATYLSLQSFCGRLFFAGTLLVASTVSSDSGQMPYAEIQTVLGWYVVAGLVVFAGLALLVRRVPLEQNSA